MSQNMVALCDPDPHQKQITCLFASHNITFYWNPLTRFGYPANRQTNMKTYFAAVNKAEHMVLIISCLFCYIWMNKVFFFFASYRMSLFSKEVANVCVLYFCSDYAPSMVVAGGTGSCWASEYVSVLDVLLFSVWHTLSNFMLIASLERIDAFLQAFCLCKLYSSFQGRYKTEVKVMLG